LLQKKALPVLVGSSHPAENGRLQKIGNKTRTLATCNCKSARSGSLPGNDFAHFLVKNETSRL
jgi:hypothetical protein